MLRLLIAEDLDYLREQLVTLLNGSPWLTVVGTAEDGQEAVELCQSLRPDVILIDAQMPLTDDFDPAEHSHRKFPAIRVVSFSSNYLREGIRADRAGGNAVVLEPKTLNQIVKTIRSIY